ncbi:hypothetical protein C7974DRAFT_316877 [Boeremia exigua]|uniref:uncharacterized protein n=1 Tax=Boeremia exigua TaxID=749465 RepID=UPI001E8D4A8F|nr:uncharacterized protein C7974DRAFT_316877 [Boeremia exigua]KAH6620598.1 hypothetical protein C7974DRAFT_316877 [Boeremia exigua]
MVNKRITVVGITGNQGGSVADAFLNQPGWDVRGISRDKSSTASLDWVQKGVDMVQADLDDVESLKAAFSGSTAIFGVTDFWQHVKNPSNLQKAHETGKTINVVAYDIEVQQGKNIVDAAQATSASLETLILSVLSESKKYSEGRITWNYHFDGKWEFVKYLQTAYPELCAKTSLYQAGFFISNLETAMAPKKLGQKIVFQRSTVEAIDKIIPGGVGREIGEMLEYMSDPGYFGGEQAVRDLGLIKPEAIGVSGLTDVRKHLQELKV